MRAMRTSWIDAAQSGGGVRGFARPQATGAAEFLWWSLSRQPGKRVHRLREEGSTTGDRPPPRDTPAHLLRVVEEMLREMRGPDVPPPALDDDLERTLGIDSLARMELMLRLEQAFGVNPA